MEEVDRPFPGLENDSAEEKESKSADEKEESKEEPESRLSEDPVEETKTEEVTDPTKTIGRTAIQCEESEEKTVDDQPTDSAPFPVSSSSGSEASMTSGPSTGENSQCLPPRKATEATESLERTDSQTDIDDTQDILPGGKLLVGGRASIPDELQPDQLQKLQNLKESNA